MARVTGVVSRGGIVGVVVAVGLAGCGGASGKRDGGSREVAGIVAAVRAPLIAGLHHDVRAFCAAYTPQAERQLVHDRAPRVAGGCVSRLRAQLNNPLLARIDRRILAGLRVSKVVIRGRSASALVRPIPGDAGSVETFRESSGGRWQIATVNDRPRITTIIR